MFIASEVMRKFNGYFCFWFINSTKNFLFHKIKLIQMIDLKSRFSLLYFLKNGKLFKCETLKLNEEIQFFYGQIKGVFLSIHCLKHQTPICLLSSFIPMSKSKTYQMVTIKNVKFTQKQRNILNNRQQQ